MAQRVWNYGLLLALPFACVACSSTPASSDGPPPGGDDASTSSTPDSGATSSHDAAISKPSDASTVDAADSAPAVDAGPTLQSLVWVWQDYSNSLQKVAANASSFTQVSPALYEVNYDYASGVVTQVNTDDNYDGLSSAQVAQTIHAAGLKCIPLMYGGAGNFGTDQGIQNILSDTSGDPGGAQQSFITSMVGEAQAKGYDGYNLDWEVQTTGYAQYGEDYNHFLAKFRDALHAHGMTLSVDLGTWYVRQCTAAGSDGLIDLTEIGANVDWAITEDYAGALGSVGSGCPAMNPQGEVDCDSTFAGGLAVMCNTPSPVVSIGLISTGTNPFAGDALDAITAYGFTAVAVWPDDGTFMSSANISPSGSTWYSLLATWLGH